MDIILSYELKVTGSSPVESTIIGVSTMDRVLDELLCEIAPRLYKQRNWSQMQTCMCWGFPGNGWFLLLYDASIKIEKLINKGIELGIWHENNHPSAGQVKEKFGTLRFYIDGAASILDSRDISNEIDDIGYDAEIKSCITCEDCGKDGVSRSGSWIKTLCDPCEVASQERRNVRLKGGPNE